MTAIASRAGTPARESRTIWSMVSGNCRVNSVTRRDWNDDIAYPTPATVAMPTSGTVHQPEGICSTIIAPQKAAPAPMPIAMARGTDRFGSING